ncbi:MULTISPECIES: hypothetical protein [unclassified Nostoc]|uniref:hypothetical protein n=1 Tax=unclassified Nostoc TaxID=2593658 RepID=UPI002AD4C7FD|nr:hypothetical protein [Nostoc sp. ChiQUE02]MDZ8229600.1 hypothetical protein [Nostoc sp. ChiQUE02]
MLLKHALTAEILIEAGRGETSFLESVASPLLPSAIGFSTFNLHNWQDAHPTRLDLPYFQGRSIR